MSIHEEYTQQWKQIWRNFAIKTLESWESKMDNETYSRYVCYILANPNATACLVRRFAYYISHNFKLQIASNSAYSMDDVFNKANCVLLDERGMCGISLNPNLTIDAIK